MKNIFIILLITKKLKQKYTYICEDDDFIIPENIVKSAKFFKNNNKFMVSGGQNINLTLKKKCIFKLLLIQH